MTHIVSGVKAKKDLKAAAQAANAGGRPPVYLDNPSLYGGWQGYLHELPEGVRVVVTNHPRRTWFAQVVRRNGVLRVT